MRESTMDFEKLWAHLMTQFACDPEAFHGPAHWRRVTDLGAELGRKEGADVLVIRLFGMIHDAARVSDDDDPAHGGGAARIALHLQGEFFDLTQHQLSTLSYACRWHEAGKISDDATIGCCWDADRLDLVVARCKPESPELVRYFEESLATAREVLAS